MARNHSPTTELSLTFESLKLASREQHHQHCEDNRDIDELEDKSLLEKETQLIWRQNTTRVDQSNESRSDASLIVANGYQTPPYINSQSTTTQDHYEHHLLNDNNEQIIPPTCTCQMLPCMCHMTEGSHDQQQITPPTHLPLTTCRQEVRYSNDITVEELAGYFDELLHLPKPMSVMAELMYT